MHMAKPIAAGIRNWWQSNPEKSTMPERRRFWGCRRNFYPTYDG